MKTLIAFMLLFPTLALSAERCVVERAEELALDLDGVQVLSIELGRHTLRLNGADNADGVVHGRACASSQSRLDGLSLSQQRVGSRLVLSAEDAGDGNVFRLFGGSSYANLSLTLRIPTGLAVELGLGSGDAFVHDVAALDAGVGSGDLEVKRVAARFGVRIGSGDVEAESVGELDVGSVGSGDLAVQGVRGDAEIGSVGSGDVTIHGIGGGVRIGSVGSGDIALYDVTGGVVAGSVGSGDILLHGVGGGVELDSLGSGDLRVIDIEGDVRVHRKGSGDVNPRNVKGEVSIVLKPRS